MLNDEMYKCVRSRLFWELGTGRSRRKVLVGDSEDARSATFSFVGEVSHNWTSHRQVRLKADGVVKIFDISSQTVDGKPAYIFFWNEPTEDLWYRQLEGEKLLERIRDGEQRTLNSLIRKFSLADLRSLNSVLQPSTGLRLLKKATEGSVEVN
jgi:hypothetical protein